MKAKYIAEYEYDMYEIERALFFLSNALQDSGNNSKPVLLHSFQVAEMLWERGLPQDVVIAGILHDVVEDTAVTIDEVRENFGNQIALYVDALTVSDDQDIRQSFARSSELGSGVLSIRAADLIQNSYYYHLSPLEKQNQLRSKFVDFMKLSRELLDESLALELESAYRRNVETLPVSH